MKNKRNMCDCITNASGEREFCSILCRDYYLNNNPDEWKYVCKWCSGKTLKPFSWCSDECVNNEIDANLKHDIEQMDVGDYFMLNKDSFNNLCLIL